MSLEEMLSKLQSLWFDERLQRWVARAKGELRFHTGRTPREAIEFALGIDEL